MSDPTLVINRSNSQCGNCGRGADPHDQDGCGIVWTHVTTYHSGDEMANRVQAMRPDLIFRGPMEAIKR